MVLIQSQAMSKVCLPWKMQQRQFKGSSVHYNLEPRIQCNDSSAIDNAAQKKITGGIFALSKALRNFSF